MTTELSEMEGAILGELQRTAGCTAYRVRRAFLESPSAELSGSAGAVYPAIRRLLDAGLVRGTPTGDRRGGELYNLTASGRRALKDWLCDAGRAVGAGLDPFRLRAGSWIALSDAEQRSLRDSLLSALEGRCAALRSAIPAMAEENAVRANLELLLQESRLAFLRSVPAGKKSDAARRSY